MNKRDYKKILIQQVHVSRKYRAFYKENKEAYRDLLKRSFQVESSTALDIDSLIALVDFLNYKTEEITPKNNIKMTEKQRELLEELWLLYATDTSDIALLRWVYKVTKKVYISIENIEKEVATKAIYILKKSLK